MQLPEFLTKIPIAHRGLHDRTHPENSLSAFREAIGCGYAIETDVRFSKDGKLVVFHDDTVDRMTDASGRVEAFTAADLCSLRLDGSGERILPFEAFVEEVAGRAPVLIEIKNMPAVQGKDVALALRRAIGGAPLAYAVQSFQPKYVKAYKTLCPDIACGVLGSGERLTKADVGNSPFWRIRARVIRNMSLNALVKPDFVSYRACDLPFDRVTKFKGAVLAWTVRSEEEAARVKTYADNIIFEGFRPAIV